MKVIISFKLLLKENNELLLKYGQTKIIKRPRHDNTLNYCYKVILIILYFCLGATLKHENKDVEMFSTHFSSATIF